MKNFEIEKIIFLYFKKKNKNIKKKNFLKLRYLDEGIIDSLRIIDLIIFLEKKFKISINSNDSQSDDFRSINGLIKLIKKKL